MKLEKKEWAIDYLNKKFMKYESKYWSLEKLCCVLAWTAKRLRQYMLHHTTWLIVKLDPIKYIFKKPSFSGRVARWQVLLSKYDIIFMSQTAIKGSAIAYFLVDQAMEYYELIDFEFPGENLIVVSRDDEERKEKGLWKMYFDGASNNLE